MNCLRLQQVLDAYVDGELDQSTTVEIDGHLRQCPACAGLSEQRHALRQTLRTHAPAYAAPPLLMLHIQQTLSRQPANPRTMISPRSSGVSWFQAAALATLTALAGLGGGYWFGLAGPGESEDERVLASHVAALAPAHSLTQVASSDRHTVKPWFQGKIDFAPPVKDLSNEGFALLGGRLDHIGAKPAAAVVYQIRKHIINLYVWRTNDLATEPIATSNSRGYSVATWAKGGLRFTAVSDLDSRDLTRFAQLHDAP